MPKKKEPEAPATDIQFGLNWNQIAPGATEMQRRLYCAKYNRGNLPRYEHRKELIKAWWPKEEWHEWSERRVKAVSVSNFVTWLGPASCVDGDTVIYNPVGQSKTIRELQEAEEAPIVMTLDGPEQAETPFIKSFEEMYEVTLSSGLSCSMTGEHRLLTQQGYKRVDLLRIGDSLASWGQSAFSRSVSSSSPLRSTLDTCPLTHGLDGVDSRRIVGDSPANYSTYFRPCDAPLLWGRDTDQSFFPLPVGVRARTHYWRADDRDSLFEYIPLNGVSRLSNYGNENQFGRLAEECNLRFFSGRREHGGCEFSRISQFPIPNGHRSTSSESARDERSRRRLFDTYIHRQIDRSWGVRVHESTVVSIRRTEKRKVYDLTVPKAGHYFAEGMIHHNSAKSADAAKIALEYWLEAPHETSVIVCSTTMQSLRRRIWAEVVAHHGQLDAKKLGYVGELLDASCIIRWQPGDSRHGIFGVAVEDGPVEDAVNNLIGFHPKRYFLILDEMQGVREAIMSHRLLGNITSNPEAKFLGMGNPASLMSLLCRHSKPINGWDSIQKFQQSWEIDNHGFEGKGYCLFFDGRKSPACLDPEFAARNQWMINERKIQSSLDRAGGNENDPAHMEQAIGWPPDKGLESTVLDMSIIVQFKCQQKPIWTEGFTKCACIDPSYGGGDSCILQFGKRGFVRDAEGSRWIIGFDETLQVPIDSSADRPIHYQIMDYCKAECGQRGVPPNEFAVLAAGEGGGLVSIMQMEWGNVVAIEEGGKPSDRIADERGKTAKEKYDTRASELQFGLRDFALGNGLRGLPDKTAEQACARRTFDKNGKYCAEPKRGSKGQTDAATGRAAKGFKERLGYSPGELDAAAGLVELCRMKGAEPAFGMTAPAAAKEWESQAAEAASDFDEGNYASSAEDWKEYAMNGMGW